LADMAGNIKSLVTYDRDLPEIEGRNPTEQAACISSWAPIPST
jgi:hypothetical protein